VNKVVCVVSTASRRYLCTTMLKSVVLGGERTQSLRSKLSLRSRRANRLNQLYSSSARLRTTVVDERRHCRGRQLDVGRHRSV